MLTHVMYSVGEFATIGRVSVRMLHHWDAVGLLPPAAVDAGTGYRRYAPEQLARLGRIVLMRELGFSLAEVALAVAEPSDAAVLRRLLIDRRTAIQEQVAGDVQRLRRIEAQLALIEGGTTMSDTIELKPLAAVRLAERSVDVPRMEQSLIGPEVGPLFDAVAGALAEHGVEPVGPPVAYYESLDDGGLRIHAGFPVAAAAPAGAWSVVDLEPVETAAALLHHGSMVTISDSWATLRDTVTGRADLRPIGAAREVYVVSDPIDDQSGWVTELQWPVERR